jgi:hypothetical protein
VFVVAKIREHLRTDHADLLTKISDDIRGRVEIVA